MVHRMRLAGPCCVSLVAQKVMASRNVETPRGNCWCCRACPWVWRRCCPVPLGEAKAMTDTLIVNRHNHKYNGCTSVLPLSQHMAIPHGDTPVDVYLCTCMCLHNYGGELSPLSTKFLNLQAFLGPSVLQLFPKGHTFGFHFTKTNIFQQFPEGSKTLFRLDTTSSDGCQADVI